jgi:D-3-phosphoglycerate dehydrogenase
MMFAARRATSSAFAQASRTGLAPSVRPSILARGFAAVQVEHGRGQWKTYGDIENYKPGKYQIKTFNKISPIGLARFPVDTYDIRPEGDGNEGGNAHAILLRSHKLQETEVPHTVRAIAR